MLTTDELAVKNWFLRHCEYVRYRLPERVAILRAATSRAALVTALEHLAPGFDTGAMGAGRHARNMIDVAYTRSVAQALAKGEDPAMPGGHWIYS